MEFTPGLVLDIILGAVVLLSVIFGVRRGFARTLTGFMQLFVCLIIGFVFSGRVCGLLTDYTGIDDSIRRSVSEQLKESISGSSASQAVPELFNGWMDEASRSVVASAADSITAILMTIISFLVIVVGIKLICFLFSRLFSKKYNDGAVGFLDGFLGLLFGAVRGMIYVFLILAFLVPLLGLVLPGLAESAMSAMDTSYVAKYLYNDNVLLIIVRDLFS